MAEPSASILTLWTGCLKALEASVDRDEIDTWLRPLQPYLDGNTLLLFAPNAFVVERARNVYLPRIEACLPPHIAVGGFRIGRSPLLETSAVAAEPSKPAHAPTAVDPPQISKSKKLAPRRAPEVRDNQLCFVWAEHLRALPSDFARSALFTVNRYGAKTKRPFRSQQLVISQSNFTLKVTGEETNTFDQSVLLQLLHYQRRQTLGEPVAFSLSELAADLRLSTGGKDLERLWESINRLQKTTIELRNTKVGDGQGYAGQIISEVFDNRENRQNQLCAVVFRPAIAALMQPNTLTMISWELRLKLRKELSKWLLTYYASHSRPNPIFVQTIYKFSGSTIRETWKFRSVLREALGELEEVGFLKSWEIDADDKVHVVRSETSLAQLS